MRWLRQQAIFVGFRRQLPTLQRRTGLSGRRLAAGKIHLVLWKTVERRLGQAKSLRQQRFWRVSDPIGDAEGAELGKVAVVEDQDEMAGFCAQALQPVNGGARKIPDVARV